MRAARARSSAASESAALRGLRQIAACAHELALGTIARRLTQRVRAGVPGDDAEWSVRFECFIVFNQGFCNLLSEQGHPVPADVRAEIIKLMCDTDLLPALAHLTADTIEAEGRATEQRIDAKMSALRSALNARPDGGGDSGRRASCSGGGGGEDHRHRAATTAAAATAKAVAVMTTLHRVATIGACTCMLEVLANAAVADGGLRAVGLHAALERSGAVSWLARSVLQERDNVAGAVEFETAAEDLAGAAAAGAAAAVRGVSGAGAGRAFAAAAAGPGAARAAVSAGSTSAAGAAGGPPAASPAAMPFVAGRVEQVAAIITNMWAAYDRLCKQAAVAAAATTAAASATATATATAAAVDAAAASAERRAMHTCWLERQLFDPGVQHLLLLHVLAQDHDLPQDVELMRAQEVTPLVLAGMKDKDLERLGVETVGARRRIAEAARQYAGKVRSTAKMMAMHSTWRSSGSWRRRQRRLLAVAAASAASVGGGGGGGGVDIGITGGLGGGVGAGAAGLMAPLGLGLESLAPLPPPLPPPLHDLPFEAASEVSASSAPGAH
ncbi:hypothetical protein HXX76_013408 [Chlamydomonas incerta]|uniref:SAM domain-containing protein n=1 Tax=Chlamydomonas incerta TaxID=51695 RepID=A0A835SEI3_CHLIN|nr:hypothetical protein HXX76_013408 [Chlamydomonas incerta]|eukprot:KAG2425783.1 hypothetical protein HXX76_013408 [Chlamydomonas incerta]